MPILVFNRTKDAGRIPAESSACVVTRDDTRSISNEPSHFHKMMRPHEAPPRKQDLVGRTISDFDNFLPRQSSCRMQSQNKTTSRIQYRVIA